MSLAATEPKRSWAACDCDSGSVLVIVNDAFGESEWQRCKRCRGTGELYFGASGEPEDYTEVES